MPSPEELEEREFIYFQKIRELQTYLMETRRIRGDISVIDYRCNSGIDSGYEQVQRKERLESELKEKNSELRRNHCLSPGQVESRIGQYEYEIWKISRQLDGIPGNNNVETPLQRRYRADMQDAGQKQAPSKVEEEKSRLEEQYGRESEQAYKLGQERQYRDNHSETINRKPRQEGNYGRMRELYEHGGPQHPAGEGEGAENHDSGIPDAGQRFRKGYTP